jgi:hypothetical protein
VTSPATVNISYNSSSQARTGSPHPEPEIENTSFQLWSVRKAGSLLSGQKWTMAERSPFPSWRGKLIRSAACHSCIGAFRRERAYSKLLVRKKNVAYVCEGEFELVINGSKSFFDQDPLA